MRDLNNSNSECSHIFSKIGEGAFENYLFK